MRGRFFPPAIALCPWILLSFDHVGDDFAKHRGEFECMTGITGSDDEARMIRVVVDPEGTVEGVAVEADAGGMQWRVSE